MVALSEVFPQNPPWKTLLKIPLALGGGLPAFCSAHSARHSPRLWELELDLQFQFPAALDHAKPQGRKGERGTCPSSPLGKQGAGSSLNNTRWGWELDPGRVSWQAQRVWRKTGSPGQWKGTGSWKGKLGLPGGKDKTKLVSKSLEASLVGRRLKNRLGMGENCREKDVQPRRARAIKTSTRPVRYLAKGWRKICWAKGIRRESGSGARKEDVRPQGWVWDAARATGGGSSLETGM